MQDESTIVRNWLVRNGVDKIPVKSIDDALKVYIAVTGTETGYKSKLDRRAEFEQIKKDMVEAGLDPKGKSYSQCGQEHQSYYANGIIALHYDEIFPKEEQ